MSWTDFKWYRKFRKGKWYRYTMTGQLPGCYGTFWRRHEWPPHRYYELIDIEYWQ